MRRDRHRLRRRTRSRGECSEELQRRIEESEIVGGREMIDTTEVDEPRSGDPRTERFARTGEVPISDHDECGTGHTAELVVGEGRSFALHDGRQGRPVVARLIGVLNEQPGQVVLLRGAPLESLDQPLVRGAVGGLDGVTTDAGQNEFRQASRIIDRQTQKGQGTQGEADGVDRLLRKSFPDPGGEVGVGLGIVGFRSGPVSEQVDPDHRATGVLEKIDESRRTPRRFEGTTPAMDQNDGMFHADQDSP